MTGLRIALAGFPLLLAAFWFTGNYFGITSKLGACPVAVVISFALLLVPYWFFGFGVADSLKRLLKRPPLRIAAAALLILPYLIFSLPRGEFNAILCTELLLAILALTILLEYAKGPWADYLALLSVALIIENTSSPPRGPSPDLADWRSSSSSTWSSTNTSSYAPPSPLASISVRDSATSQSDCVSSRIYTPVALVLGFALGFLHLHRIAGNPAWVGAGWLFTLFFVALPEEIFFRGILLNLLEEKWAHVRHYCKLGALRPGALQQTSCIQLALCNSRQHRRNILWKILLANRRVLSAGVTHATVDTIWSIWFR